MISPFSFVHFDQIYSFFTFSAVVSKSLVLEWHVFFLNLSKFGFKKLWEFEHSDFIEIWVSETTLSTSNLQFSRIECRICVTEYSDLKVPRILKECGHTICHDCADVLLNRFNRHYMMCPFCQMITVVRGRSETGRDLERLIIITLR